MQFTVLQVMGFWPQESCSCSILFSVTISWCITAIHLYIAISPEYTEWLNVQNIQLQYSMLSHTPYSTYYLVTDCCHYCDLSMSEPKCNSSMYFCTCWVLSIPWILTMLCRRLFGTKEKVQLNSTEIRQTLFPNSFCKSPLLWSQNKVLFFFLVCVGKFCLLQFSIL